MRKFWLLWLLVCNVSLAAKEDPTPTAAAMVSLHDWKAALKAGEPERIVALAKPMAESGNTEGAFALGLFEDLGAGTSIDHDQARRWVELAAKTNFRAAVLYLCWRDHNGFASGLFDSTLADHRAQSAPRKLSLSRGLERWVDFKDNQAMPNFSRAFAWMTQNAISGNLTAQKNLALAYKNGPWTKPDPSLHVHWLEMAANNGDVDSMEILSSYYMFGSYVKNDPVKAFDYLTRAAAAGSVESQMGLAFRYEQGDGVERNPNQALAWYRKASVANTQAFDSLLRLLRFGAEGLPPNREEAIAVAEAGVLKNNLNALVTLADLLEGTTVAANARAGDLYKIAAEENNAHAAAMLGWMYEKGLLGPADPKRAAEWFLKAGNLGELWAFRELGLLYENGNGVAADKVKAFQFVEMAAQSGDMGAQNHLGWMLREGVGVDKDNEEAIVWFKLATAKGDPVALANLAYHNVNGLGTAQDIHTAFEEVCKASRVSGDDWIRYTFRQVNKALAKENSKTYNDTLLKITEDPSIAQSTGDLPEIVLDSLAPTRDVPEQKRIAEYAAKLIDWNRPQSAPTLAWHCYVGMYMPYDLKRAREFVAKITDDSRQKFMGAMIESIAANSADERDKASAYLQRLADAGSSAALTLLARRYSIGEGVDEDFERAVKYYNEAAVTLREEKVTTPEELLSKYYIKPRPAFSEMAIGVKISENLPDPRDTNPSPLYQFNPYYPIDLRMAGMTGEVILQFNVDTDGHVRNIVSTKWTHPLFRFAAENAIKRWRFMPAKKGGKYVNIRVAMPVRFDLSEANQPFADSDKKVPAVPQL